MLHIIFAILKFAGIVVGLLFGILFCTVLALLLVPIRYRVGAVKKGEKQRLNICLSWMLRMVSVAVSGGQGEETAVLIRLFGFRLPIFGGKKPEKNRRKKNKQKKNKQKKNKQKNSGITKNGQRRKENPDKNRKDVLPDYSGGDQAHKDVLSKNQDLPERDSLTERQRPPEEKQKFSDKEPDKTPEPENTDQTGYAGTRSRVSRPRIRRASEAVRRILGRLTALKKRIKALWRKLLSLRKKPAQIKKTFHRLCEKPSAFFRMIEEYEIKEIFGSLYGEAVYLLRHYKPRRIRGYLRFGAGDPALTGGLTGLIYMFLPARADQFSVMPDFYETVFETEVIFTGYVRSVHLGRTVWHVFRDKKVRRMFQSYRH